MKITKNKLFSSILFFGSITVLLVLFNVQNFYLMVIFPFIFLTTMPGFLIMLMFKIKKIGFWEYLILAVGLSIAFIMFAGLAVNWILPWLGITDKPLSLMPLLLSFYIILSIFGVIAYNRNKKISLKIRLPKLNRLNKIFIAIPILFPILGVLGATILNNGGSNYLTMTMLGGIAIYTLFIAIFRNKINNNVFPYAIYLISLSLLFSFSLRSDHIIGFDIHEEYRLFQLTKEKFHWSMLSSPNNPYNALLSITILPTIFSIFTNIKDEYVFKLFNQIIFAFTPLVIYLISKNRKIDNIKSYLISFFFFSQIWFMLQMPELNRQEYALFFFSLIIYVLFSNKLKSKYKNILFTIFTLSLIVSHLSTAYILLAIFTIYYIFYLFIKIRYKKLKPLITIYMLILIVFGIYFWNFQLTQTGGTMLTIANNTLKNITLIFNADMLQSGTSRLFFNNLSINSQNNLNKVYNLKTLEYSEIENADALFSNVGYNNYSPALTNSKFIYPEIPYNVANFANTLLRINKIFLVNVLIFIGFLYYIFNRKKINKTELDYLMLSVSTLPLIFAILFFPLLKLNYNIERVYLQTLVLTASLTIAGAYYLLKNFKKRDIIVALMFILFLLQTSGFLNQYLGGVPYLNLNNFGDGYDKYYTYDSDIYSAEWLKSNNNKNVIYADELTSLKLKAYVNKINIRFETFPSTITKASYVYLSSTNVNENISFVNYDIDFITYKTPTLFLSDNKNLIYNNGNSNIYK